MNIEKINLLYNSMVELSTILTEEGDNAVFAINGLRLASAEFRSAYFKVLDTLNACPISKTNSSEVIKTPEETPNEDKAVEVAEVVEEDEEESSKLAFVHVSDEPKKPSKISNKMMEHQRSIESFVTENYEFTDEDSHIKIRDIIFQWGKAVNQQLRRQHYKSLGEVLKQIFTNDGESLLGLKSKCPVEETAKENVDELVKAPNNDKLDKYEKVKKRILNKDSVPLSGTYYFHPKYTKFGVDEKGNLVIKRDTSLQQHHFRETEKGPVIYVGKHVVMSARKFAYECYVGKEIGRMKVSVLNGNKMDLSKSNLAIKGEKTWHETSCKYYKDDVIFVCEYIQQHGNIKNIEKDSAYRIGYQFAKKIFQKESYRTISDKYF